MELIPQNNITSLPGADTSRNAENIPTPKYDMIREKADDLIVKSKYKTNFNFEVFKELETRFGLEQPRGGVVFSTTFRLVNSHSSCQQCLYAFELDTYGRGCTHECVYCYAKQQLTQHSSWNRPFPMPVDITEIWKTFYTVFETDKPNKWRSILEKRVPIRIGSMSDSFMWMDKKYKVTQELLKILKHYNYPYIIFTRSDMVAATPYIDLLDPELCSVQMSISSTNDVLNKKIEPGTPSSKKRLEALKKLTQNGFWTTVRLNPFFPIYPDGFFTDPDFDRDNNKLEFNFSSFEMVDEIASYGVQSILAGFVRLSPFALNQIEAACGTDLRPFFTNRIKLNRKDWNYSDAEIRAYYERIQAKCLQNNIQFTTCYIGNGESQFWRDRDLWSNKSDCCNARGRIKEFTGETSREINWDTRMKFTSIKCSTPVDKDNLHTSLENYRPIVIENGTASLSANEV
jgi:DNA repair photolyase